MSEKEAQVNVKLAQDTLESWDEYREEVGFSSRSEFVRWAVNREIDQLRSTDSNQSTGENADLLHDILGSLEELSTQVGSMENRVDTLQNAVREDPKTEELADEIFSELPDEKPGTQAWEEEHQNLHEQLEAVKEGMVDGDEAGIKKASQLWNATPESLADALNVSVREIHVALDKLVAETHLIDSVESDDGKVRYWKEV